MKKKVVTHALAENKLKENLCFVICLKKLSFFQKLLPPLNRFFAKSHGVPYIYMDFLDMDLSPMRFEIIEKKMQKKKINFFLILSN